jgi:hypothetical protein
MSRLVTLTSSKSYKTVENAIKAVEAKIPATNEMEQTYFIHRDEATGRYFPVFIGQRAVTAQIHFLFNVVA